MKELPDLKTISSEDKDILIRMLWEELQILKGLQSQQEVKIEELETSKGKIKKTSKNSSQPPSVGFKPRLKGAKKEKGGPRQASLGRAGGGRRLSENPDELVRAYVEHCKDCGVAIENSVQRLRQRYDKIDLPPIHPVVTRVERYGCNCPSCSAPQVAPVPVALESGTPFGPRVTSYVTALHYGHAMSYERLSQTMAELFGLKISEGAIANLFKRVQVQLQPTMAEIVSLVRQAEVVGSDETSARVEGKNWWEWVFQNHEVSLHLIVPSRGFDVMAELFGDQWPKAWISDLFSAQKKNAALLWQACLAHQLRDCQYGVDAGDEIFSGPMKRLLLWAIAIRNRWEHLSESTRYQYRCRVYRRLEENLALEPSQKDGIRLHKRYSKLREHLFLFLDDLMIPATNNASEQALRWSVIFRKVTNGFRSEWGAELFAAVRSVVNTGKRQGLSMFQSIYVALDPEQSLFARG
jgi:transposase